MWTCAIGVSRHPGSSCRPLELGDKAPAFCNTKGKMLRSASIMAQLTVSERKGMTITDLERLLRRRRAELDSLGRERKHVQERLAGIDAKIRALAGANAGIPGS